MRGDAHDGMTQVHTYSKMDMQSELKQVFNFTAENNKTQELSGGVSRLPSFGMQLGQEPAGRGQSRRPCTVLSGWQFCQPTWLSGHPHCAVCVWAALLGGKPEQRWVNVFWHQAFPATASQVPLGTA